MENIGWNAGHIASQHYHEPPESGDFSEFDVFNEGADSTDVDSGDTLGSETEVESDAGVEIGKYDNGKGKV